MKMFSFLDQEMAPKRRKDPEEEPLFSSDDSIDSDDFDDDIEEDSDHEEVAVKPPPAPKISRHLLQLKEKLGWLKLIHFRPSCLISFSHSLDIIVAFFRSGCLESQTFCHRLIKQKKCRDLVIG